MKQAFTLFILLKSLLFLNQELHAQPFAGDYRSVNASKSGTGGSWTDITKWETYNGTMWIAATASPTLADGIITISANDSIIINGNITADQLIVSGGAVLAVNSFGNNLSLNDGIGDDLVVNGTLLLRTLCTINGPGNIVVNGTFNWNSGTLAAATVTSLGSLTNIDLNFDKNLNNNLTNNGTLNWERGVSAGGIYFNNAVFTNNGSINEAFLANGGMAGVSGTNSFINNGQINKTTTFQFFNTNVPFSNSATGTLKGKGSYVFNSGTITNQGAIAPGNSPGLLNVSAEAVSGQNTTINIEVIDGSGDGTGHDQLNLTTGGAFVTNLNTVTLNVTDAASAPLQSYTILTTTGTFSGSFASENLPVGYTITYNSNTIVVTKTSATLPAVWGDFVAVAANKNVELKWATLQEFETDHFTIEFSTNGSQYVQIGTIAAKGNSSLQNNYSFTHTQPDLNSRNFYRLVLHDKDGSVSYSAIQIVKMNGGKENVLVAIPNPVKNTLTLYAQKKAEIRLMDMTGKAVKQQVIQAGISQINVSGLQSGIYILHTLRDGVIKDTQKIIKE